MRKAIVLIVSVITLGSAPVWSDNPYETDREYSNFHQYELDNHRSSVERRRHSLRPRLSSAERHVPIKRQLSRKRHRDAQLGQVIEVEPVYHTYSQSIQDHSCLRQDHGSAAYPNHMVTVLGAVIGGALGHHLGDGHGDQEVAIIAGGLFGAAFGRGVDRHISEGGALRVEGPCRIRERQETRRELVAYKVTYRYNGRLYVTSMDYDPGEWLKLDVNLKPT